MNRKGLIGFLISLALLIIAILLIVFIIKNWNALTDIIININKSLNGTK